MKLKTFLKNNSKLFSYGDLIIYERGYYLFPDGMMPKVELKELYRGLLFKAIKCDVQLFATNAVNLYDKKENAKIGFYMNREIVSINMKTGSNNKYDIPNHPFTKQIVEIVIFNEYRGI